MLVERSGALCVLKLNLSLSHLMRDRSIAVMVEVCCSRQSEGGAYAGQISAHVGRWGLDSVMGWGGVGWGMVTVIVGFGIC